MALVFYTSPEAPVRCAIEISRALKEHPPLQIRMGIHSGPASGVVDVTGRTNLDRRRIKYGKPGDGMRRRRPHSPLQTCRRRSERIRGVATNAARSWHDRRKARREVAVVNLWSDEVGNRQLPQNSEALKKQRARVRWAEVAAALVLMAGS